MWPWAKVEGDRPVEPWLRLTVGVLVSVVGLAFSVLFVWFTYRVFSVDNQTTPLALVFFVVIGGVAAFCLPVGYRLTLNRPNSDGSVLPRAGWYTLAGAFMIVALGIAVAVISKGQYTRLDAALGAAIFAVLCFWIAQRKSSRATKGTSAL